MAPPAQAARQGVRPSQHEIGAAHKDRRDEQAERQTTRTAPWSVKKRDAWYVPALVDWTPGAVRARYVREPYPRFYSIRVPDTETKRSGQSGSSRAGSSCSAAVNRLDGVLVFTFSRTAARNVTRRQSLTSRPQVKPSTTVYGFCYRGRRPGPAEEGLAGDDTVVESLPVPVRTGHRPPP